MSHQPAATGVLEELNGRLSDSARAAVIRIARKIANGFEGTIEVTVAKGGGVRSIKWIQTEDGSTIREELT